MELNRRHFVAATVAGAFALRLTLPAAAQTAPATVPSGAGDVGIWAVGHPDDRVVVRFPRWEMGQGTFTGLAELVGGEMDADWKYVTAEYVAPETNLANKRAWGDMSTGGSRGIRASVDYVRKGGAAARAMLVQAAATQWGVPAGECVAENSVITHKPSGKKLRLGEVVDAAAKL